MFKYWNEGINKNLTRKIKSGEKYLEFGEREIFFCTEVYIMLVLK